MVNNTHEKMDEIQAVDLFMREENKTVHKAAELDISPRTRRTSYATIGFGYTFMSIPCVDVRLDVKLVDYFNILHGSDE